MGGVYRKKKIIAMERIASEIIWSVFTLDRLQDFMQDNASFVYKSILRGKKRVKRGNA
jgi:hypothetical protein